MLKPLNQAETGVTLVELVMAMAILVVAVLGSSRLINAASRASNEAGRRTQAAILADRELELVRNIRDTNILTDPDEDPWVTFPALTPLGGENCAVFIVERTPVGSDRVWQATSVSGHELYDSNDIYFPEENVDAFGQYRRSVTMCEEGSSDLRRISVDVVWDEGTGPQRVASVETLLSRWDLEQ